VGLIESGMLVSTKVRKTSSIKLNKVKVFATSNSLDRLSEPLKSRFSAFKLPEYSYEQQGLLETGIKYLKLLQQRSQLVYSMSKDIRDVLKIGKLAKPDDEDTQWLIDTHKKVFVTV
jgi:hypothetical protein